MAAVEEGAAHRSNNGGDYEHESGDGRKGGRGRLSKLAQLRPDGVPGARAPEDYTTLATFISTLGTFGGGFTFSVVLSTDFDSHQVAQLVGFASAFFFGAVLGCLPIAVALRRKENTLEDAVLRFVHVQFVLVALLMLVAFVCTFTALNIKGYPGAAALGYLFLFLTIIACWKPGFVAQWPGAYFVVVLVAVAALAIPLGLEYSDS